MFAVICNARRGRELGIEVLALVDRKKSRSRWWTSDNPSIAICYPSRAAAQFAARRLRKNSPRVVSFEIASRQLTAQADKALRDDEDRLLDDSSWDSHKC